MLELIVRHKAKKIRQNGAGMNRQGANSNRFAAPIQFHRK
jgi:hypothetical protein